MEHEIQYVRIGDYEYPTIDYNRDRRPIGHWGMLRIFNILLFFADGSEAYVFLTPEGTVR